MIAKTQKYILSCHVIRRVLIVNVYLSDILTRLKAVTDQLN